MKHLPKILLAGSFALGLTVLAQAAVETYKIDPVHSSVGFSIRHFFSNVPGAFTKFGGTIVVDRDHLENSTVEATFKSKSWKKSGDDTFDITGDLTMHGVTKEVVLKTKLLGFGPGMNGAVLSGWEATTTLNRNDFGITFFPKVLGDDVAVTIGVEADQQK